MAREADGVFTNEAAAFSLPLPQQFVVAISVLVLAAALLLLYRSRSWQARGPLLLIVAGGIGNLTQRLRYGGVLDPLEVGTAVFNYFDVLIGLGLAWLLLALWRTERLFD